MKLSTQILVAFSLIILMSVADSYTNYLLSIKVERNTLFLSKSQEKIRNSNGIHKSLIQMQSSFRGFLLTDDAAFLDDYYKGEALLQPLLSRQELLISRNAVQRAILDSIRARHSRWSSFADSIIEGYLHRNDSPSARAQYDRLIDGKMKKLVGKKLNDSITSDFLRFDRSEYKIRNEHRAMLMESIDQTRMFSFIFLTLTIFIGIIGTLYIIRLITKRIARMVGLAQGISAGHFTVIQDDRDDELTGLATSLNIMSDRLNKNIRELENRNAELNKFAYVVSHDLKAPIRGIHNVVKWIEEDLGEELSVKLREYLSIIPKRTQRMEDLINGLLDYARISQKTPPEEVDVGALVSDIVNTIVPRHFKLDVDSLPKLYTHRLQLEQVFTNLISNAVKYTPGTDAAISVRCKEFPAYYEFSVKDNGIGIEQEYHEKIFEIFQTLREKNEKESTGIGLAIVKKIIDEQHGSIRLNSTPGKGSEFIFTWKKTSKK